MYPVEAEIGDERIASFHLKLIYLHFVQFVLIVLFSYEYRM